MVSDLTMLTKVILHVIPTKQWLLAFALTEEAIEDNLYDRLGARYTKALARSMANTKQIKAAAVLNNAFSTTGGDGKTLIATDHPLRRRWFTSKQSNNYGGLE